MVVVLVAVDRPESGRIPDAHRAEEADLDGAWLAPPRVAGQLTSSANLLDSAPTPTPDRAGRPERTRNRVRHPEWLGKRTPSFAT